MRAVQSKEAKQVAELTDAICWMFVGIPPEIQGAVLADLVAIFLAGHPSPALREQILQLHVVTVRKLIPVNERIMLEEQAHRTLQ